MILSDGTLHEMLETLLTPADHSLVQAASIDIRIGATGLWRHNYNWVEQTIPEAPGSRVLWPHQMALVATLERIHIPNGYVGELKLKSSTARAGFNHSLAFHLDPGFDGIATMEIHNQIDSKLEIYQGMAFAQLIIHTTDKPSVKPYSGRYQHALGVEPAKP